MTKRKQNKLFNIDEREKFKVRKSKKYKNLCSFAFGVLAISGLAAAPASADEVAATTETTTPITVTESVVESPAPSTNLIEAQSEATADAVQQQETVGQQAGEIAVVNTSDELNTAVTNAQQEGVDVVEESAKDYGVTTSVEETATKQEEIQTDYAKQAETINKVTEAYVEAKADYQEETLKVIDQNNQLKAEYDAEIERYNKEVAVVNAKNEAIDAAYDEARQVYEAEVASIDAYNTDAKEKYQAALVRYKAEVQRITQENAAKKELYSSQLTEFNKEVAKINEDNAKLEAEYQAAYQSYQDEVVRINQENADTETAYNQALATYKSEVERINRENEEKQKAYEAQQISASNVEEENARLEAEYQAAYKEWEQAVANAQAQNENLAAAYQEALAKYKSEVERINRENQEKKEAYEKALQTYQTSSSNIVAENAAIRLRNQKAQEEYDKAMETYNVEKARYDKLRAEAEATTQIDGYLSSVEGQELVLPKEPNANLSVQLTAGNVQYVSQYNNSLKPDSHIGYFLNNSDYSQFSLTSNPDEAFILENTVRLGTNGVTLVANKGDKFTATYTNLENSYIGSTKISKIEYEYEVISVPSSDGKVNIILYEDPTVTIDTASRDDTDAALSIRVTPKFYDSSNNRIDVSEYEALLGFASLSSDYYVTHKEAIQNAKGLEFIKITGSSIDNVNGSWESTVDNNHYRSGGAAVDVGDNDYGDYAYYLAAAGKVTSNDISFDLVSRKYKAGDTIVYSSGRAGNYRGYWMNITSEVYTYGGIIPAPPKQPTLVLEDELTDTSTPPTEPTYESFPAEPTTSSVGTPAEPTKPQLKDVPEVETPEYESLPEAPTVSYLSTPEAPTKPEIKELPAEPTVPEYEGLPDAPTVTYKEIPEAPEKDPSVPLPDKPEEPTYKELPEAPEVPTVSYRLATLAIQPQVSKGVETTEGVNVDKGLVAKGQPVVFVLNVDDLPADRSLTTSGVITDALPTGLVLDLEKTVNANSSYELGYDTDTHVLSGTFTKELILSLNQDLTTSASIPSLVVHGYVTNDAATYKNAFDLDLNGGEGQVNGYTTTSNLVVIHTPGNPNDPDNPSNNEIEPLKSNTNAKGVNINGKVVPIGGTNYYTITLDYDQYADIEVDAETILMGFGAFDDYPEEALTVVLSRATIIDSDGQMVTGLTLKDNSSVSSVDDSTKALLSSSQIDSKIKGAFISIIADDPTSYYQNIIKAKKSVIITIPMTVKDSLYNTGQSYSNTAYQVDFGNGYVTNTVTNSTPVITPTKNNTNSEGVIINGKSVLANSVNYYKVVLDYSAYQGIEADEDLIAQGFFAVDDYPEEALTVETTGIQLQVSDNTIAKGVTTTVYASLSEAPEAVQTAMAKQGFTPKGAIIVLSADNTQEFFEAYVKTGKTITATLPMTVKAELAKTGGTYENTAYQVDFGTAYVTDTIVNNVPKLDPKKDVVIDLTHADESLNDQDIEVGTIFNYKLSGAEVPSDRGSKITSYSWLDVLDERDQYDGVHKIYAPVTFGLKDGTVIEKGIELTRFAIQSYDAETRRVYTALDEEFLAQISDLSAFTADLYLQVKRVGTGDVENTAIHAVNGAEVSTNTVVTHTPVGNVIVRYFEEGTGLVLKPQVVDEDGVATGTDYDTTDRKVDRIVTEDGKTYQLVRHEGNETGKVVKGDTIVDYFYEEVLGSVVIEYKDMEGNVIKTPVVDTEEGSTGRDYDTTDNKPTEIVTEDGKTYRLVPELTEGDEAGKVVEGKTTITYIYEEVKADVLVHYIDEDGNVIAETVKDTDQGSTGTAYDTTDHKPEYITVNGVRYKLMPKKTIGEETGILTEDGAEVTYVYHKIVTNWVEEGTNKVLKDREDGEHERGEIPDYEFVETVVDEETGDITHIFKKVSKPVETKTETPTTTLTETPAKQETVAKTTTLPNTGESNGIAAVAFGLATLTGAAGLAVGKRRQEEI